MSLVDIMDILDPPSNARGEASRPPPWMKIRPWNQAVHEDAQWPADGYQHIAQGRDDWQHPFDWTVLDAIKDKVFDFYGWDELDGDRVIKLNDCVILCRGAAWAQGYSPADGQLPGDYYVVEEFLDLQELRTDTNRFRFASKPLCQVQIRRPEDTEISIFSNGFSLVDPEDHQVVFTIGTDWTSPFEAEDRTDDYRDPSFVFEAHPDLTQEANYTRSQLEIAPLLALV